MELSCLDLNTVFNYHFGNRGLEVNRDQTLGGQQTNAPIYSILLRVNGIVISVTLQQCILFNK